MLTAKQFTKKVFELVKADHFLPVTEYQVYSTAETKVGVWTDGKPIYRKVIDINITSFTTQTWYNTGLSVSGIKGIINAIIVTETGIVPVFAGLANTGEIQLLHTRSVTYDNLACKLYIEYTKTTDTASTPKVPYESLHEWSTEEKLVGYWVDGKAVYEKTVSCGALPNNTTKDITIATANTISVKHIFGYAFRNSDGMSINLPRSNPVLVNNISVDIIESQTKIRISTGGDYSSFTESYITLRYTKTT